MVKSSVLLLSPLILSVVLLSVEACNKDNKAVAHCLHTYHERDFISIEAIVYPRTSLGDANGRGATGSAGIGGTGRRQLAGVGGGNFGNRPIVDGPEMAENCNRIAAMVRCFEEVLLTCDNYEDFFRYRDLLRSVARVQEWLCDDVINRFSVLISSFSCYRSALRDASECAEPTLADNMWLQLLRLERRRRDVCKPLRRQCDCLAASRRLDSCQETGAHIYHNTTALFLDTWCGVSTAGSARPPPLLLSATLSLMLGLCVTWRA